MKKERKFGLKEFPRPLRIYKWMKQGADLRSMLPYLSAYMGHSCISHTAYYIHLVPEFFSEMSGMDMNLYASLIPEVAHE